MIINIDINIINCMLLILLLFACHVFCILNIFLFAFLNFFLIELIDVLCIFLQNSTVLGHNHQTCRKSSCGDWQLQYLSIVRKIDEQQILHLLLQCWSMKEHLI